MSDNWVAVAPVSEIPEGESRGYDLPDNPVFVVHRDGQLYGYRNSCPHLGIQLEWQPHQFLDSEGYFIQCSSHGALFNVADGLCVAGPCSGKALQAVPLEVRDGDVYLQLG